MMFMFCSRRVKSGETAAGQAPAMPACGGGPRQEGGEAPAPKIRPLKNHSEATSLHEFV